METGTELRPARDEIVFDDLSAVMFASPEDEDGSDGYEFFDDIEEEFLSSGDEDEN